ncbi:MAG TPA: Gfo/Idh/MocA family oxidoreductase [Capsulimonadaceae bacterium]|nr:Gfo/Idh/MocA family oxidoreductase [Capsulimonadaceae bacterium]
MSERVALIGAGTMGGVHAQAWKALPDVDLVAVLDPRRQAADALGPAYTDWDTMLSQTRPDIVDICVPTPFHREYVERAASAGKAIFVEKPLSRTLADCDAIVETVERAGVPTMAGHVLRYFPEYATAKRLVDEGAVGTPAAVRTSRMAGFPHQGIDDWYADSAKSGGVVLDMILHDFDWLRWTFGPVARVFACGLYGRPRYAGEIDYALVTLRFASGAVGHVTGSWAHPGGFRTTLEIAGDGGMIEHDSARSAPLMASLRATGSAGGGVAVPDSPMAEGEDPYFLEIQAFLNALRAGMPPPVTVHDAREATRIALAALESIETGKVVNLQ